MKFSKLPRIYINSTLAPNKLLNLSDDIAHYLKHVLKIKLHSQIRLFNGEDGEYLAHLYAIEKKHISLAVKEILRPLAGPAAHCKTSLGLCIIKGDKMLKAIDNAVQLGVTNIIPLVAARSQLRDINREKIERCIVEAVEQSERLILPSLQEITNLTDQIHLKKYSKLIYANENELDKNSMNIIDDLGDNPLIIIGPEGGFTDEELECLSIVQGSYSVSLGETVLRSETAVAAALSQLNLIRKLNASTSRD